MNRSLSKGKAPFYRPLYSILFVVMITLPILFSLVGWLAGAAPKASPMPALQWRYLLQTEYYRAWGHYIDERLTGIVSLARAKRWLDYRLFKTSDVPEVYIGRQGWLYTNRDIDIYRQKACASEFRVRQLMFELQMIAHLVEASGRRFFFSVAPAKATIYPEFVGNPAISAQCSKTMYDLLIEAQPSYPFVGFVRIDDALMAAKGTKTLLYSKTGVTWNARGAGIAGRVLTREIFKNGSSMVYEPSDLTEILLDGTSPPEQSPSSQVNYRLASAVLYGGAAINALLPFIAKPFTRTDAITTDSIPSINHGENLSAYDTIVVVADESRLLDLYFEFDEWCRMLAVDLLANDQKPVPLKRCVPETHLSLNWEENRMVTKSLGSESFFRLPALPGSDHETSRILAMDVTAPAGDTLYWKIGQTEAFMGVKSIRVDTGRIFIPLPEQSTVILHINPGKHVGMFHFANAKVLEFDNRSFSPKNGSKFVNQSRSSAASLVPEDAASTVPENHSQASTSHHRTPTTLLLNDFEDFRVFQRDGNMADIIVSGTYKGNARAVEARVVRYRDAEVVVPWRVIDSNPSNGVFMGIVAEVPQGGWYRLHVRSVDQHQTIIQGQSRWGVGILAACIGQSNMKEMFFAGSDLRAHSQLSLFRQGRWQAMTEEGNGAISLGNRLIERLGVPVGLLDYAVNGSGLRREADWGTGYWADRSDHGIYAEFIKGVAATGGTLEYVIWLQGEADAARGTITENQYRSTLSSFIDQQIRQAVTNASHLAHLPFLIIGMPKRPGGKDAPNQDIREAQIAVTREIPDCYLAATTIDLKTQGRQHLAPEAYTTLGLRVSQTILYLLEEESYYRGPKIIGAQRIDAGTVQINIGHHGGDDFTLISGITGWQASTKGRIIGIRAAWRQDAQTVRIALDQNVEGPLTLQYLFGANPESGGILYDNSAMELPLEPGQAEIN